ncbi:DUF397 domain-containing protein [Nonomuraea endophytica]|uniref:DUF397 domain-containing protein n=1 Tax=Nonomuraea endophytica TaxID=714136 RepID=UPI00160F15ED
MSQDSFASGVAWKRATSCSADGNCVEVAQHAPGQIAIRDSKDLSQSPLVLTASSYADLIRRIKQSGL